MPDGGRLLASPSPPGGGDASAGDGQRSMVTDTGVVVTPQPVGGAASRSARVLLSAAAGSAEPGPGRTGQITTASQNASTRYFVRGPEGSEAIP